MTSQESKEEIMMDLILWNTEEAAKFLGKFMHASEASLTTWRSTGKHDIPFIKVGGSVRYLKDDLIKWVEKRARGK